MVGSVFPWPGAVVLRCRGASVAQGFHVNGLLNASLLLGAAVWAIVWYWPSSEFRSEGLLLWMFEALFAVLATNAIFIALLGLHRLVLLLRIPRGNS